ncbi:TonB-dependent receptor [Sorangium sp. KYC3313]|uniref:TonB-dependent receptor n=1 Tax=Sorangium sp. KYC3313 TaxID=3449740 RepID=UPI003F8A4A3B
MTLRARPHALVPTLLVLLSAQIAEAAEPDATEAAPPAAAAPAVTRASGAPPAAEPAPADAPDGAPADPPPEPSPEVTIRGRQVGPLTSADIVTSVDVLGAEEIKKQSPSDPLELLKRVPTVYMDSYNQGIANAEIGIRGFSTQADANTKLLIDGIPANLHIGYPDMKAVFPLEIERIEVVKGTNDPRYGLFNVAGNINVTTRKSGSERFARLLAGSFGTIEPQVLVGHESGGLSQTYFAGYRGAEGYRDHSRTDKAAGSGKWFYELSKELKVGLIVRAMFLDADAPGYLGPEDARSHPTKSLLYAGSDGGRQTTLHASLHADYALADGLSWQLKAYGQSFLQDRWVTYEADTVQQLRAHDEKQYGGSSVLTLRTRGPWGADVAAEWGIDYQFQDNVQQRFPTANRKRLPDPKLRDHAFNFHTIGTYAQASVKPIEPLLLVAGLRADRLAGGFTDRLNDVELPINDYGTIWQPKASVRVTPVKGHSVYGNYGRSFQVGSGIGAYAAPGRAPLEPSINDGWEIGYRASVSPWLNAHLAYWQQFASGEVRPKADESGESENVGETMRRGYDVELTVRPIEPVSIWGSFSRPISEQVEPGPTRPKLKGKELDHVPSFLAKAGLDVRPLQGLFVSLWCYAQGDYYLTKDNSSAKVGDYIVFNANASYDVTERLVLTVQVDNILNRVYNASAWYKDFGTLENQFNPGAARSGYVTATLNF